MRRKKRAPPCLTSSEAWQAYRRHHLERYQRAKASGEVDVPIVPLLDLLNGHPDIVTTSSCSGRIVLLETDITERKRESAFYRKWHRPVTTDEVWSALTAYSGDVLWFKVDPFILHVAFSDLFLALDVIRLARASGFKIAGIQTCDASKVHVEIRGIDQMALPVYRGRLLVDRSYVREIVAFANRKMVRNARRTALIFSNLLSYLSGDKP